MPTMGTTREETLRVPGATLFYRIRGQGPLLLILQGGHGDADTMHALCDRLVDRFTVVTYDRRGLSRSTVEESAAAPTIQTHGDDAHELLAALTSEPAFVFGSSIGGLIGLDLVTRHPQHVRTLVAHEPAAWELLPDAERKRSAEGIDDLVRTFHEKGGIAAFEKLAAVSAIDYADRESDAELPRRTDYTAANLKFFFTYDAPALNAYRLDFAALSTTPTQIIPAAGRSSRGIPPHRAAARLAERLHTALIEFAGGHTGWLLRPKEFAAQLIELLGAGDP
jgi:pimeloyl-ACP methyl ester carboxylesterase